MFGKKNQEEKQEETTPIPSGNPPEYIKNLEALIRVIARQEAEKLLREVLGDHAKQDELTA
jgi:hypothetical protein